MPYNFARGHPNSSLVPTQEVKDTLHEIVSRDDDSVLQSALNYGPDEGCPAFRQELMAFLTRQCARDECPEEQNTMSIDNYFQTDGVSHGLELVVATAAKPGDLVWVEQPTYYLVAPILKSHGLRVETIPNTRQSFGLNLDLLERELADGTRVPPRLVYLIPTNQNPTGRTISLIDRQRIVDLAYKYDFLIIADEVYHLLDWRHLEVPARGQRPCRMATIAPSVPTKSIHNQTLTGCCSVSSFTKIFGPGVRCGWVEGTKQLIQSIVEYGYIQSQGGVGPLVGAIMQQSLERHRVDSATRTLIEAYFDRSSLVCDILNEEPKIALPTGRPTGGYFVWIEFPFESQLFLDWCEPDLTFMIGSQCSAIDAHENDVLRRSARLCFACMSINDLETASKLLLKKFREFDCHKQNREAAL